MIPPGRFSKYAVSLILLTLGLPLAGAPNPDHKRIIFDFEKGFDIAKVLTQDAAVTLIPRPDTHRLQVKTGHEKPWPGITLKAPSGKWNLSDYYYVSLKIHNTSSRSLTVHCRVDNPGADGSNHCVTDRLTLSPGRDGILRVPLAPSPLRLTAPLKLIGMRGYPAHSDKLDPARVTQLVIFVSRPKEDVQFEIDDIQASGEIITLNSDTFIPFIDEFGQFIHRDWPGKTHSNAEFQTHRRSEQTDLATHPGPNAWNQYGGWTKGPTLKATGFFRVEKYRDKWWLVDPTGRLFWSHGIDCVRSGNATPISDREHYYRNLPAANSPFAKFYGRGGWAPHGYYQNHSPYKTYDFTQANLLRKYGQNWPGAFAQMTHRRLKSWGLNTIANWSDSSIYLIRRTSYVGTIHFSSKNIKGSEGYWGKFYDVFDPGFRSALQKRLEGEKGKTIGDPWCLGFFVHNELSWGSDVSLALGTLKSPPDQPAKKIFIDDLKKKYRTIDRLNQTWQTKHASWDALKQNRQAPDEKKARNDLIAFYDKIAETYFRVIREELKRFAPDQLYLGCRFAWVNDRAARMAAKYCDVISYNRYTYSVAEHRPPEGIDRPTIVGEFHFGALDRGMFHTGLKKTLNQQERAETYRRYVLGALRNPCIVGSHWFQYKDQATTGRGDGENYQIGFVDNCDTPYPEIIRAARDVGGQLYEYRLKN